jgi:DNA replication protein DnaC
MLIHQTLEKLHSLRLEGMLKAFQEQMDTGNAAHLSFEERFGLLVDRETDRRDERRVTRRLKAANLRHAACVEDVNYRHPRGLDKGVFQDLASCRWIHARRNVIITGPTGIGKTWLASALGDKACREGLTVLQERIPRLTHELALARADGSYFKLLARLQKLDLLVLEDWGLSTIDVRAQQDLLEVIDDRTGRRSTLVTSQLPIKKWHDTIGDPTVADALLDRLLSSATRLALSGETLRPRDDPRTKSTLTPKTKL